MTKRAAVLGIGLAASVLPASLLGTPAAAQSAEEDAYSNSIYTYCDAKKVAAVWDSSIPAAKIIIGQKILQDRVDLLEADIASTANVVRCNLEEIGMLFEDAERLAEYWSLSVEEAKARARDLASEFGGGKFLQMVDNVI